MYWLPHLGTISLEIELQDRTVNAEVPPIEAAVIELFSTKGIGSSLVKCTETGKLTVSIDTWGVAALAAEIKVDKAAVLKALMTWVDLGVLKEEDTTRYKLLEVAEDGPAGTKAATRQGVYFYLLWGGWPSNETRRSYRGCTTNTQRPAAASRTDEGVLESM